MPGFAPLGGAPLGGSLVSQLYVYLYPDGDDLDGGWTDQDGGPDLYAAVDEAVASDLDYIKSSITPVNDICRMTLSNPGGPITEPFEIFYRYGKDINTDTIDLYFRLKELTNTRASWSHLNVSVGFTDGLYTLTTPEFLSIGNMDDLLIEIEADVP